MSEKPLPYRLLKIFPAPILSGVILILAFPCYDIEWLGWVGLVPLLISISGKNPTHGFFASWIGGTIFSAGVYGWIFEVPGYRFLHHAILSPYMGLYWGVFGLAFSFISRRSGILYAHLAAPFIWVSLEYFKSNFTFLAAPWALLGHSQYQYGPIIQLASITGVYGISFLMVMANVSLNVAIMAFFPRFKAAKWGCFSPLPPKFAISIVLVSAGLIGLVWIYGKMTLSRPIGNKTIRTSVLQGNIDRSLKRNPRKHATFIMQQYIGLTERASKDRTELIVWPEASTPGFVLKDTVLLNQIVSLIRRINTYFLIGSSEYPKFAKIDTFDKKSTGNTALFFSPKGKILGQYLKIHLVPFGEYIPYEGIIKWPRSIVTEKQMREIPGNELTLFELKGTRFGVLICWEVVFPELFRAFVKKGANFIINITNEGWFGETAAPYQMAALNVFRAVENRVAIARAANTGISCFIDPYGRITGRVRSSNKDIFIAGYLTQDIPISKEKTFYTRYGDVFVFTAMIITIFFVVLSFFKTKISSAEHSPKSDKRGFPTKTQT